VGAVLPLHRSARAEIEQLRVVRSPDGSAKGLGFLFGGVSVSRPFRNIMSGGASAIH
jgi:hypothetical protein